MNEEHRRDVVLCVDLDGTLIRSDCLFEMVWLFIKHFPLQIFLLPWWLIKGRARLKRELVRRVSIDPAQLPYHTELLSLLRAEHEAGREIVLTTASDQIIAEQVAAHVGVFRDVIGSDGAANLQGNVKAEALVKKYGSGGFDYAGDSKADIPVWKHARKRYVVGTTPKKAAQFKASVGDVEMLDSTAVSPVRWARVLRVHQWIKNLLIFVPLVMAHRITEPLLLWEAVRAYVAFCLCASSVYVLNDCLDLASDRRHATKRTRPFAAGDVPLVWSFVLVPSLLTLAAVFAISVSFAFVSVIVLYFAVTCAYSFRLKQIVLVDIITLAGLYTIRILAGGVAVEVPVSTWLLAFSMFIFVSLACVKRYSELLVQREKNVEKAHGRGYVVADADTIARLGTASGFLSVLVFALYVQSGHDSALYRHPDLLWLVCPPLMYWIGRVWIIAGRGHLHDDPIVFAIRDRVSYIVGAACALVMFYAS